MNSNQRNCVPREQRFLEKISLICDRMNVVRPFPNLSQDLSVNESEFNWLFNKDNIQSIRQSWQIEQTELNEIQYRQKAAFFIHKLGTKFTISKYIITRAIFIMHRFYVYHTVKIFHSAVVGSVCLFLAAKSCDKYFTKEEVVRLGATHMQKDEEPHDQLSDEEFEREFECLEDFMVVTLTNGGLYAEHRNYDHLLNELNLPAKVFAASKSIHDDTLCVTNWCIKYPWKLISAYAIYCACKQYKIEIASLLDGKPWFKLIDDDISYEMLHILDSEYEHLSTLILPEIADKMKRPETVTIVSKKRPAVNEENKPDDDPSNNSKRTKTSNNLSEKPKPPIEVKPKTVVRNLFSKEIKPKMQEDGVKPKIEEDAIKPFGQVLKKSDSMKSEAELTQNLIRRNMMLKNEHVLEDIKQEPKVSMQIKSKDPLGLGGFHEQKKKQVFRKLCFDSPEPSLITKKQPITLSPSSSCDQIKQIIKSLHSPFSSTLQENKALKDDETLRAKQQKSELHTESDGSILSSSDAGEHYFDTRGPKKRIARIPRYEKSNNNNSMKPISSMTTKKIKEVNSMDDDSEGLIVRRADIFAKKNEEKQTAMNVATVANQQSNLSHVFTQPSFGNSPLVTNQQKFMGQVFAQSSFGSSPQVTNQQWPMNQILTQQSFAYSPQVSNQQGPMNQVSIQQNFGNSPEITNQQGLMNQDLIRPIFGYNPQVSNKQRFMSQVFGQSSFESSPQITNQQGLMNQVLTQQSFAYSPQGSSQQFFMKQQQSILKNRLALSRPKSARKVTFADEIAKTYFFHTTSTNDDDELMSPIQDEQQPMDLDDNDMMFAKLTETKSDESMKSVDYNPFDDDIEMKSVEQEIRKTRYPANGIPIDRDEIAKNWSGMIVKKNDPIAQIYKEKHGGKNKKEKKQKEKYYKKRAKENAHADEEQVIHIKKDSLIHAKEEPRNKPRLIVKLRNVNGTWQLAPNN